MDPDEVLAATFAADHKDRLSWRRRTSYVPRDVRCWHWKAPGGTNWLLDETGAIAHRLLSDYVRLIGETADWEKRNRILELAKESLLG